MTAEEFALWRDYGDALKDERVQKMKEKDRIPAIARNFRVSEKKLRAVVQKGEDQGSDIGSLAERNARAAIADTPVASRVKELKVDTSKSHVVAYVTWLADRPDQVDKEACLLATRLCRDGTLATTISLRAEDVAGARLFQAIISTATAKRIKEDKIADYADTRYLKLFEKVERGAGP